MTVQRHYTLPNCNLKLEGLAAGDETDPMAPLTVVLNSECAFPGVAETLSGGREFLNALIKTVSDYAQSMLSGVPHPLAEDATENHPVTLQLMANHRHCLVAMVAGPDGEQTRKSVELNSVQLFDLMEAVDQLLADTQTLPDMTLQISPLHRRYARPAEPASKRVVPAAAGLSALAASAALLFLIPVPEFEPQRPEREDQALSELVEDGETAVVDPETTDPATAETPEETTEAIAEDGAVDPVTAGIALGRLSSAPVITDAEVLSELETDLENTLEDNLADDLTFEDSLVYRVAVSEAGDVLGYKYENEAALENIESTPLPDLTFIPVDPEAATDEPVAQFRVTFEADGDVTAEPIASDEAE